MDLCRKHHCPLGECGLPCVLDAINGREVFAWLPVRIYSRSGYWREGFAWMTRVIKRRRIGHPSYFYSRIEPSP